ncbi:3-oxoacyl-ACP reductase [Enemella dayhoffiae]|uniref:3-oxoacyl-ACP reductase n=2 Tax=Enemella dayhoffiae TaxID=2016507 RepID=A0A255GU32_9ACTN|nr:3-oxoacyl-ACP reductase [Enemella dayhoffiae]
MAESDRVAIITGAGDGLGRAEAIELARDGVAVVVNDLSEDLLQETVSQVEAVGGRALAVAGDVAEWETGVRLLEAARDGLGQLDVLVNNAGILRDRMVFAMSEAEWDSVIRVHLRGTFVLTRLATEHWRNLAKQGGTPQARIINTASEAGLMGAAGQPNYVAAKAGIIGLTVSTARGCERYGVRANAICPRARTPMTDGMFAAPDSGHADPFGTEQVTPLVAWLARPDSDAVTGQVFVVHSGRIAVMAPPPVAATFAAPERGWDVSAVASAMDWYAEPRPTFSAKDAIEAAFEVRG